MKSAVLTLTAVAVLLAASPFAAGRVLQQQPEAVAPAQQQQFSTFSQAVGNLTRPALLHLIEALLDPTDVSDRQAFYRDIMANTTVLNGQLVLSHPAQPLPAAGAANSTSVHAPHTTNITLPDEPMPTAVNATSTAANATSPETAPATANTTAPVEALAAAETNNASSTPADASPVIPATNATSELLPVTATGSREPLCKQNGDVCYDPLASAARFDCCDPDAVCSVGGGGMHVCAHSA